MCTVVGYVLDSNNNGNNGYTVEDQLQSQSCMGSLGCVDNEISEQERRGAQRVVGEGHAPTSRRPARPRQSALGIPAAGVSLPFSVSTQCVAVLSYVRPRQLVATQFSRHRWK